VANLINVIQASNRFQQVVHPVKTSKADRMDDLLRADRPAKNAGRKRDTNGVKFYLPWRDSIPELPIRSIRKDAIQRR
jgi:hypothetical protein